MFILALVVPLSASALVYTFDAPSKTDAESTQGQSYLSGYTKEVSLTNGNFTSTSTYILSTSFSGWRGLHNDKSTTAGIINVGNTFQNYMSGTYRLSKDPKAKATDKNILMINSKTSSSSKNTTARQGYRSDSVTLEANSYYSFQVSFKTDTNYDEVKNYEVAGTLASDRTISYDAFKGTESSPLKFGDYYSFYEGGLTKYIPKKLEESADTLTDTFTDSTKLFYDDSEYVGIVVNDKAYYVSKIDSHYSLDGENVVISAGAKLYECNTITFDISTLTTSKRFKIANGSTFYKQTTSYASLENTVFGSMYLSGLKDKNGNEIKAEFTKVTSKEWETFYFFIATGSESQKVTLDLWLGGKNMESSGVAFYDDVKLYQYSENNFWKTYSNYYGRGYNLTYNNGTDTVTKKIDCVNLTDLHTDNTIKMPSNNFGFESGIYDDISGLKDWRALGNKKARIFNTKSPDTFKSVTGYDFVGTTLSCETTVDENNKVTIDTNDYVLGLWADGDYSAVKSNPIQVNANEIYKITAYYKVSSLESGNVYMFLEENDGVKEAYNLSDYTLTTKQASSAMKENGSSLFNNKYNKIEYYVKGGTFFNSSVSLTLSLGKEDETATGCVVFDDITVERATTEDYNNATNKYELGSYSDPTTDPMISNSYFNKYNVEKNGMLTPQNWTITKDRGVCNSGVIGTEKSQYEAYKTKYNEYAKTLADSQNPYTWAKIYSNPGNSKKQNTSLYPDNVLMLANLTENASQKVVSDSFTIGTKEYKLTFNYRANGLEKAVVKLYGNNDILLFEKTLTSGDWKDYSIYLKSFAGKETLKIEYQIEGSGVLYLDDFSIIETADGEFASKEASQNDNLYGVVNMDNFYYNLPTNNITGDPSNSTSSAWSGKVVSGDADNNIGAIIKSDSDYLKGKALEVPENDKNVFFIRNSITGSYSIESNFNFDLEASTYYELTFKVKTNFMYANGSAKLDEKKTYTHGLSIGLTGYEYLTKVVSNDGYETYKIYISSTTASSAKLYMALISDAPETTGSVALYDLTFTTVDKDTYDKAVTETSADKYDVNDGKIFVSKANDSTDDNNKDDDNTDDNTDTTDEQNFNWLYVPTVITGLAIIIAVIGFALRGVKIKKIEKKKTEKYDRRSSLNIDVIKRKAKEQRDAEVKAKKDEAEKFANALEKLEQSHKTKVVELRSKDQGKVSKDTDKEFKSFAQKRAVIAEKIDSLNKQIEELNSPEHLLSLERKVYAEEEAKRRELEKASKKMHKNQK